jgi:hypothetical protein
MRSEAWVPRDSSSPTRLYGFAASCTASSVRASGGRASAGSYPAMSRTSVVQAVSAASCADGSIVTSVDSPSRGKTTAS